MNNPTVNLSSNKTFRTSLKQQYAEHCSTLESEFKKHLAILESIEADKKIARITALSQGETQWLELLPHYNDLIIEENRRWERFWRDYYASLPVFDDLQERVESLWSIGRSVAQKTGAALQERYCQDGLVFFPSLAPKNAWLSQSPTVVGLTVGKDSQSSYETSPHLVLHSERNFERSDQERLIPLEWLFKSDREYSSIVRALQANHRKHIDYVNYTNRENIAKRLKHLEDTLNGSIQRTRKNYNLKEED